MRTTYKTQPLAELCEILDKKRKPITKKDRVPGPFPYYGATGVLDYVDGYIFDEPLVLIGEDGAKWGAGENTAYRIEGKAWVNNHAHVIRPDRSKTLESWLTHYFNAIDVSPFITGLTVPKLNQGKLREIPVPVPPLSEQKRIVAILDEAFAGIDAAIANTEKNLANARELFESYLNSVFNQKGESWIKRSLGEVSSITSSLVDPRELVYQEMLHVGAGNIVSMNGELADLQIARKEGLKSGKFVFDETMVLYSKIRPYLMKVVRPSFSGLCSADIYPLTPNTKFLSRDFLYYLLLSTHFTDYAIAGSARAGMPKVNREHLFAYTTFFPEVDEQERLVEHLDAVANETQRLESIYQQKLDALTELKQSLLQKAFSGELTAEATQREADEAVA